jgi:hypothetical protein
MTTITDTRNMTLVDLPLIRRLNGTGTILDSETGLTRDARGQHSLHLSSLLFPRGLYTLVARAEDSQPVVGQFRYRPDDIIAHIVYIAPSLDDIRENNVWLHILDAMAREAGKHGAQSLVAEVETSSQLFETLRTANFATYARQTVWRHDPIAPTATGDSPTLHQEADDGQIGIMALIANTVPTMLQQIAMPHSDMDGLVYRHEDRVEAYIAVSEGKFGVYLLPFLHPDVMDQAAEIITQAIAQIDRTAKVPIYVCVRSYHSWLDSVMERLDFTPLTEQAVMVKQLVAGIRYPAFARVQIRGKLEVSSCMTNTPPYWSWLEFDDKQEEKE